MTNYTGVKGALWTDEETALLLSLAPQLSACEITSEEVAARVGRSVASIKGRLRTLREAERAGPVLGPGRGRYEAPEPQKDEGAAYVARVLAIRPKGFPVAFSRPHYRISERLRPAASVEGGEA